MKLLPPVPPPAIRLVSLSADSQEAVSRFHIFHCCAQETAVDKQSTAELARITCSLAWNGLIRCAVLIRRSAARLAHASTVSHLHRMNDRLWSSRGHLANPDSADAKPSASGV